MRTFRTFLNRKYLLDIWSDKRGTAAIEFSIFVGLLAFAMLNTADIARYIYQRMELENATEMGAEAAWHACDPSQGYLPATTSCPGLTTAVTKAVQSTSLGTQVSLASGSPTEGYYCLNGSGALVYVSAVSTLPADCSAVKLPNEQPTDYITVTTTFSYAPLFPGITVANAFTTPIVKAAMMRLD